LATYYNEIEPFCCEWIRELIKDRLIPDGDVDERSIVQVAPEDLKGYTQCHFFCGISGWPYALRTAGFPEDRKVWTGSPPCQSFSVAGKRKGFKDERHLWPEFFRLIRECRPGLVFGEQVSAATGKVGSAITEDSDEPQKEDGRAWIDLVQDDLEGIDYSLGKVVFPACGVGAPHLRQRLYWVADSNCKRREPQQDQPAPGVFATTGIPTKQMQSVGEHGASVLRLADPLPAGWSERRSLSRDGQTTGCGGNDQLANPQSQRLREYGYVADSNIRGRSPWSPPERSPETAVQPRQPSTDILEHTPGEQVGFPGQSREPRATNGFWADAIWIPCRDGKWRSTKPGIFPLVNGFPNRMGVLRGAGNAIVVEAAKAFVEAYLETEKELAGGDYK
jgi:DNA (cytosine-5)-methyltransferase 1